MQMMPLDDTVCSAHCAVLHCLESFNLLFIFHDKHHINCGNLFSRLCIFHENFSCKKGIHSVSKSVLVHKLTEKKNEMQNSK